MDCVKVSIKYKSISKTFYVLGFEAYNVLDSLDMWLISMNALSSSLSKLDIKDLFQDEVAFEAHLFNHLTTFFPTISFSKHRKGNLAASISVHISDKTSTIKLGNKILKSYTKAQFSTLANVLATTSSIFIDKLAQKIYQRIKTIDQTSPSFPQILTNEVRALISRFNLSEPETSILFQKIDEYIEDNKN